MNTPVGFLRGYWCYLKSATGGMKVMLYTDASDDLAKIVAAEFPRYELVGAEPTTTLRYAAAERLGLIWVGERSYTMESFIAEAATQGISRRVPALPATLKPGDAIALAYMKALRATGDPLECGHCARCNDVPAAKALTNAMTRIGDTFTDEARPSIAQRDPKWIAGIFAIFRMTAVEVVLPDLVARDDTIQAKCAERGVRIVTVADDDPAHVVPGWRLPRFLRGADDTVPVAASDPVEAAPVQMALGFS